jgi:uncharacterized protein YjiS (DUF1127 family)
MITTGHETQPAFIFERRDTIVAEARRARSQFLGNLIVSGFKALAQAFRSLTTAHPGSDRLWTLSTHTLRDIGIEEGGVRGVTFGAQVPFQVANENLPRYAA